MKINNPDYTLTKSGFIDYLHCSKAFWLKKWKPNAIDWPAPSAFDRMLMKDGYAVEKIARQLVAFWPDAEQCSFQQNFETKDGLLARADLVRTHASGEVDLFEIKSSTSLKSSTGADHVLDAAFQTLVAERTGFKINAVNIILVNKDYILDGDLDPEKFFKIVDVTDDAHDRLPEITGQADEAMRLLHQNAIDENGCDCLLKTRAKHCAAFHYFNADVPEQSIYKLPRLSPKKLGKFVSENRLAIADIDASEVTNLQALVLTATQNSEPEIDIAGIRQFIDALEWPLYFYDYETAKAAIPISDGTGPHEQIPVQVSIHRLSEDGVLEHFEFLSDDTNQLRQLIAVMEDAIGDHGHALVWNKSFEIGRNKFLARMHPDKASFLLELNSRTIDLMDVFKESYVDARFNGSTSIKKVLPVLCPHLQYDESAVHDGAGAMEAWLRMIEHEDESESERIAKELRDYCALDTLAMVEIFQFLQHVSAK